MHVAAGTAAELTWQCAAHCLQQGVRQGISTSGVAGVAVTAQHRRIMPSSAQHRPDGLCFPACSEIVQCSGTLIGKQHVLTAGHCVVDPDTGSVIANMQVSNTSNTCMTHHNCCTCAEVHAELRPQAQDPGQGLHGIPLGLSYVCAELLS